MRTVAGHGQVVPAANYLAGILGAARFQKNDVRILPMTRSDGEHTAALVVRYRGREKNTNDPILLMAHLDVVDADPQDWLYDPFELTEKDGLFFGRGTMDDKFGVSVLISTLVRLKEEDYKPNRDLIVALTGDEESGMETTHALVTKHRKLIDAGYALNLDAGGGRFNSNGRPESFMVQVAEKTYATFDITIRNPGGHSSVPRSDNAIYELAKVLRNIETHEFPVQSNALVRQYFRLTSRVERSELADAMRTFADSPADQSAIRVLLADPQSASVLKTTCVATMLESGYAENALPRAATATINCRIFPGSLPSDIKEELVSIGGNSDVEVVLRRDHGASPSSPLDVELFDSIAAAVHTRYPGTPVIPYLAPYGTDGKETRSAGIPTYGLMGLFIREEDVFAHGLNERVPVSEFFGALDFWYELISDLSSDDPL